MKRRFLQNIALSGLLIIVLCGFGVNKMYVQAYGESGWIFHIFSQKLPSATSGQRPKSLTYDYTYVEKNDSVAILCTIRLSGTETINDFEINYCDSLSINNTLPELVYAQPWKKGIEYRLRLYVPFMIWEQIYSCPTPFIMSFRVSRPDDEDLSYHFSYSDEKWKKHREDIIAIMNIIKLNTKKK